MSPREPTVERWRKRGTDQQEQVLALRVTGVRLPFRRPQPLRQVVRKDRRIARTNEAPLGTRLVQPGGDAGNGATIGHAVVHERMSQRFVAAAGPGTTADNDRTQLFTEAIEHMLNQRSVSQREQGFFDTTQPRRVAATKNNERNVFYLHSSQRLRETLSRLSSVKVEGAEP